MPEEPDPVIIVDLSRSGPYPSSGRVRRSRRRPPRTRSTMVLNEYRASSGPLRQLRPEARLPARAAGVQDGHHRTSLFTHEHGAAVSRKNRFAAAGRFTTGVPECQPLECRSTKSRPALIIRSAVRVANAIDRFLPSSPGKGPGGQRVIPGCRATAVRCSSMERRQRLLAILARSPAIAARRAAYIVSSVCRGAVAATFD